MTKFKDLPLHAVVFMNGLLITKTSETTGRMTFGFTRVEVNPDKEFEPLKSVNVTGQDGSAVKMKYGK